MIGLLMAWAVVGTEGIPFHILREWTMASPWSFVLFLSVGLCFVTQPQVPAATGEGFPASSRSVPAYLPLPQPPICAICCCSSCRPASLAGVCIFNYFNDIQPELVRHVSPGDCWDLHRCVSLLFVLGGCSTLFWVGFFDESVTTLWLESYSTLLLLLGIRPFPVCPVHSLF